MLDLLPSFSRSSDVAPNVLSRKSVLRLRSEEGGEATPDSSLERRLLAIGELRLDWSSSVEPLLRFPGWEDGELEVKFALCAKDKEVRRPPTPLVGVPSLLLF